MGELAGQQRSGLILIVDDDPNICLLMHRMLAHDDYVLEDAHDGEHALEMCARLHPHLVLLDILMPGLSGFEVCARLQSLPLAERPTVLMMTSLADRESIDKAFQVGAVDFITKPLQLPVLRQRVRHLVQARQTEQALWQARDELEMRVAQRTAELEQANVILQEEVLARQRAEEQQRGLSTGLRAVIAAADELISCQDMDSLFRRAVELARQNLGLERCALCLEIGGDLQGTYGTDHEGHTVDEHALRFPRDREFEQRLSKFVPENAYWILPDSVYTEWDGEKTIQFDRGWIAETLVQSAGKLIGLFFNDTAISHAPPDPVKQEIVAIFCSLLGNIIERKQAEEQLQEAHDALEIRVLERTAQLASINEMLQAEITERSHAEHALAEERNLLRTLIDNLPDYIFIKDRQGRFVVSNDAHTHAMQSQGIDIIGKTALETFPQDLAIRYHVDDQGVMESGKSLINVERQTIGADGTKKWVLTTKVALRDRDGDVTGLVGISRDITERKQIEDTLREGEERFRSAFDNAPIGMALTAPDGRRLKVNHALCAIVGYEEAEMLSQTLYDITPPEDQIVDRENVRQLLSGEVQSVQFEKRYTHKSGRVVWVSMNVSLVRNAQGEPLYFISQTQDISERKRLEAELREHREHLERLVENRTVELTTVNQQLSLLLEFLPVATYTSKAEDDFGMIYVGKTVTGITGYHPAEITARSSMRLEHIHPDDREQALAGLRRLLQTGGLEIEYRWQVADGSYRWLSDVTRLVETPDGAKRIVGVWYDITDRKRTEDALLRHEQQLRRITDNMLDMICQIDMSGLIEYASPSCWEVLGYKPESMLGDSIYRWMYPDDVEHARDGIQTKGQAEYRYRHAEGHYIWLETLSSLLFEGGSEPKSIILASRNITERKQAEEELEELNRLKTEFLSTAAHELRTPLTSIQGFSELLLTREFDANRQRHFLSLIEEHAIELGRLIDDLLDISRLEAKRKLTLNLELIDVAGLIQRTLEPFIEANPAHHFEVHGLEMYPSVQGDAFRLSQVVKNLLSNAVKYSPHGGTVSIYVRNESDCLTVTVQDHGIGMTPQQQAHLFEKFYRADASNTAIRGTGLGLAISKLIVELHGGHIWAESEYGAGTTVSFTLPLNHSQTAG